MPIIACPHCGTRLEAPQSVLGREVVCGRCKRNFMAAAAPQRPSAADAGAPGAPRESSLGASAVVPGTGQSAACREAVSPPQPDADVNPYAQRSDAGAVGASGVEPPPTPPPPPPGPFGVAPGYGGYRPAALPSGQATGSLVCGIIAVSSIPLGCCCGIFLVAPIVCGILAIVFANRANEAIAMGMADPASAGKARAGRIMGIVALVLGVLSIAAMVTLILAGQLDKTGTFKFR